MARIPEQEIERLKKEIAVERLVEARGITLRRHGQDLHGLCPFHEDREPSLVVSPEKNLWHCLGACQTGGSVIDWVMRAEGVSFRHAVELLRGGDVTSLSPSPSPAGGRPRPTEVPKKSTVRKLPLPVDRDADDEQLMKQVVDYYHATLKESPEALSYLESRGLQNAEMITKFRLGFANRTLGYRLPQANRKDGEAIRGRLQRLGILRESGHEHFNGSVVVPIFDEAGRVTEMYGRKVTRGLKEGIPLHMYLPGPHRGVWNAEAFAASEEIVVCEALIDALTFWCAGIRNVTAAYGVEGFTADHWAAIRAHGTKVVKLAYDRDDAGDRAAERLAQELVAAGLEVYRVQFPRGMDANEYARKVQPAPKSLEMVLRHASWMGGTSRSNREDAPSAEMVPTAAEKPAVVPEPSPEPISFLAAEVAAAKPRMSTAPYDPETGEITESTTPSAAPATEALAAVAATAASEKTDDVVIRMGDRRWRVRGLGKNLSYEQLRVNVFVSREGRGFFVDTLELYSARQRAAFVKQASEELGLEERVIKKELGDVLLQLEAMQDAQIRAVLAPKETGVAMTEAEREEAMALLRDPHLIDRILVDFERCGVVGEETNKLVGYLAAVSRKLEAPLGVVIQSSSAAGKSSLMDAVLSFMPEEERVQYSAMTGQSLFYMGERDLKQKILAIVEEEGAERASYALKLLQSEGELTIASTGKDPETGKLVTHAYRVEGPVMIFLTTTAIEVDEELLNRCLVLTVDEGREQTRAIHRLQRESQTLEGLLAKKERVSVRGVHQNAQRLLRPYLVVNPFARELTFVDTRTRTRRDHTKYLTLIRAIALLHQHQREVKTATRAGGEVVQYIEATREDLELANRLATSVLGRSLDELPPQTRRLLGLVEGLVRERARSAGLDGCDVRFTRREVREHTGWGHTQLAIHLRRLEELEYVLVHRGGRGQSLVYELCFGANGSPLVDVLRGYDASLPGSRAELPGGERGLSGADPARFRGRSGVVLLEKKQANERGTGQTPPNTRFGSALNGASYVEA